MDSSTRHRAGSLSFDCVETGSGSRPSSSGRAAAFPLDFGSSGFFCEIDLEAVWGSREVWLGSNCSV